MGLSAICFASKAARAERPCGPRCSSSNRMTEAGNITVAKKRWQRQQAERRLTINGVQDRQRHKSSIGHRGRHSIDRAAAQVASPADVNREENQREAQNRPAAECQQKAPFQKITRRLLRDSDNQKPRHRYVVDEMHEPVGQ
jgi:hypothetical protein